MNRRSFLTSLFGGLAIAGIGGTAMAKSLVEAAPAPVEPAAPDIDPALKAGLDQTDAEFTQVVVRRSTVVRRPVHRRPVVVRRTTVVRRPAYRRPVAVRRTTVVRRPAYRRPVVVRRTTIVR